MCAASGCISSGEGDFGDGTEVGGEPGDSGDGADPSGESTGSPRTTFDPWAGSGSATSPNDSGSNPATTDPTGSASDPTATATNGGSSPGGEDGGEVFDCSSAASFAADVWPVFDGRCDGGNCHQNGDVNFGVNLDLENFIAETVSVPAVEVAGMYLIDPGDPAASYLYRKMEGDHEEIDGYGGRMPLNEPAFSAGDLATIASWIDEGACP